MEEKDISKLKNKIEEFAKVLTEEDGEIYNDINDLTGEELLETIEMFKSLENALKTTLEKIFDEPFNNFKEFLRSDNPWTRLKEEVEEELKNPKYDGVTLEMLQSAPIDNKKANEILEEVIEAVKKKRLLKQLPSMFTQESYIEKVLYPKDRLTTKFFNDIKFDIDKGQLKFGYDYEGEKAFIYNLRFEGEKGLRITEGISHYDKRVYIAVNALFQRSRLMTVNQIYRQMGNNGNPSKKDRDKINNSLTKLRAIVLYYDNSEALKQKGNKYPYLKYDGSVLPFERLEEGLINGRETTFIKVLIDYEELPLIWIAKAKKQVTTISRSLLASPLSQTETNLAIEDYLISQISYIKRGGRSNIILWESLFKDCNIKSRDKKSRKKIDIFKWLEHAKQEKFIKDYKECEDTRGFEVFYTKPKKNKK